MIEMQWCSSRSPLSQPSASHRSSRPGSASRSTARTVRPIAPGGSNRSSSGSPGCRAPEALVMNGFQSRYAAKSVSTAQTRSGLAWMSAVVRISFMARLGSEEGREDVMAAVRCGDIGRGTERGQDCLLPARQDLLTAEGAHAAAEQDRVHDEHEEAGPEQGGEDDGQRLSEDRAEQEEPGDRREG